MKHLKKVLLRMIVGLCIYKAELNLYTYETNTTTTIIDQKIVTTLEKVITGPKLTDAELDTELLNLSKILIFGDENCKKTSEELKGLTIKKLRNNIMLLASLTTCKLFLTQKFLNKHLNQSSWLHQLSIAKKLNLTPSQGFKLKKELAQLLKES